MNETIEKIEDAYRWAIANRPKVGGYPYLAEALRRAGVVRYVCTLPSGQTVYSTAEGRVANAGASGGSRRRERAAGILPDRREDMAGPLGALRPSPDNQPAV